MPDNTLMIDGGPAFPNHPNVGNMQFDKLGMSLRDYFASQASIGILAKGMNNGTQWDNSYYSQVAAMSYQMADAMLKEGGY